ncbi:MAG: hypothetical protein ABJL72_10455 [Roseobacter sp.]
MGNLRDCSLHPWGAFNIYQPNYGAQGHRRLTKALSVLSVLVLIGGVFCAILTGAIGTPVDGINTLFFAVGFAGYLHMIASDFTYHKPSKPFFGIGMLVLYFLAGCSWVSALGMYVHHGATGHTDEAYILAPKSGRYDTELNSIWEMRLPEVATSRTGPTGTTILDYHAILIEQSDVETKIYNWSKRRIRFEVLDKKRNPYLPTTCP